MSALFGGASAAATTSNTVGDLKQDVALSDPPTDTISDLSFSPAPNGPDFLAISSWDNKVRIYEIAANGQSQGRHAYEHSQPVMEQKSSLPALTRTSRSAILLLSRTPLSAHTTSQCEHVDFS
ncbi:hypothetical protein LB505_008821 [Fusarium chuoi]|nr:hypothetical protein LB505_008821 [Fusarium chuoi]